MSTAETVKAQLQADIAAANEVTGKQDATMHDAVASLIEGFGGGQEVKFTSTGQGYVEIPRLTVPYEGLGENHKVWCSCRAGSLTAHTVGVIEAYYPNAVHCAGHYGMTSGNATLKKIIAPKLTDIPAATYVAYKCPELEYLQLGSVGYPVTSISGSVGGSVAAFSGCTSKNLVVDVYVDATTIADITPAVTANAPWGCTNATINYRNSTTGEVITE